MKQKKFRKVVESNFSTSRILFFFLAVMIVSIGIIGLVHKDYIVCWMQVGLGVIVLFFCLNDYLLNRETYWEEIK